MFWWLVSSSDDKGRSIEQARTYQNTANALPLRRFLNQNEEKKYGYNFVTYTEYKRFGCRLDVHISLSN